MTNRLDKVRRFWDSKAAENPYWYVSSYGPYRERDLDEFWRSGERIWLDLKQSIGYHPANDHAVAEIGCGVGRLTRAIAADVGTIHAFDISAQMLEHARSLGLENAVFYHTSGSSLAPVPDGSIDCALAYCVFQHLPNLEVLGQYLYEMMRVIRKGGIIAFTLEQRTPADSFQLVLRLRRRIIELIRPSGPTELYRREWVGIRPKPRAVVARCPVSVGHSNFHGKWLFSGRA